jgi:hypothetical protein
MKTTTNIIYSAIAVFAFACFGLSPRAQAVVPAPDGGYPGGNTAEGQTALLSLTTGGFNTAIGWLSLRSNATGQFNTAIGAGTLLANTADLNTATGAGALLSNTSGGSNTANGAFALFSNTTGGDNTAIGEAALFYNTTGIQNTANGSNALLHNTVGAGNTADGDEALFSNTTGNNNTALGDAAGSNLTTGDNNIDIGFNVVGMASESNTIRIGNTNITTTIIRGISGQTVASGATVLVAANGQLGTMTSSARFKQEIKPMDKASEALLALKPVTFRYKKEIDPAGTPQLGLVAEEVEKVNPDLVVRDEKGKPYSVRYDQVNAMLLNEFLKEHRKVTEQEMTIAQQRLEFEVKINELEASIAQQQKRLDEQAALIQRVSAEVVVNRSALRTVANDQ